MGFPAGFPIFAIALASLGITLLLRRSWRRADEVAKDLRESKLRLQQLNAQLEKKVAERTSTLEETIAQLQHVTYKLTHDMRAPLRAMSGFADLLLATGMDSRDAQAKRYLAHIIQGAKRLDKMIQDALNYGHVSGVEVALSRVELIQLFRSFIESHPQFQPPNAQIEIQGELPAVLGNETLLAQCFLNLLDNAAKFVAKGTLPQIIVRAVEQNDLVRICLEDNGIGVPEEAQERIFQMFERAAPGHDGTGVGLAIVREAVQRMGGRVGVESKAGQGSTFWLELKPA